MSVNKVAIKLFGPLEKQVNIPINLSWDYLGISESIDEYEVEMVSEVLGVGYDFEVDRFSNAPFTGASQETAIKYQFYFYSGGSLNDSSNWKLDYRGEGFSTQDIFYYNNNFSNSFFKLDLYDSVDEKRQKLYVTIIIPTQQGSKIDAYMARTLVQIKVPNFTLDFVGDTEGFFIYWLKSKKFLDVSTFYMSAKFYNAETGQFNRMMTAPQSSIVGDKYSFDSLTYFYVKVQLDYNKRTYQIFNNTTGERIGTPTPIKWYEYVNP
jgi:hypothetical protein